MSHSIFLNRHFFKSMALCKKIFTAVLTIWNWLEILWIILTFYLGMKKILKPLVCPWPNRPITRILLILFQVKWIALQFPNQRSSGNKPITLFEHLISETLQQVPNIFVCNFVFMCEYIKLKQLQQQICVRIAQVH